jgi:hypothetical protein
MDLHPPVVINEAQLSESVHEKTDARPVCAYHLCQSLLTDFGNYGVKQFNCDGSGGRDDPAVSLRCREQDKPSRRVCAGIRGATG